mgnify:FL=1
MAWNDTKVSDDTDRQSYELTGLSGVALADRGLDGKDRVEHEGEAATTYRYGQSNVLYMLVDSSFGNGIRLASVWRLEPDDDLFI